MTDKPANKPVSGNSIETIQDVMVNFTASANVDAVYHDPIKHGDHLIIPAAEVFSVIGFGMGSGGETGAAGSDTGSGGGGGGSVFSRPVAVIVSSPQGVRVEPIIDRTKIALAALTTGIFILGSFARLINLRRDIQDVQNEMMETG
jgi:uncharacterized spore protein YtfJ